MLDVTSSIISQGDDTFELINSHGPLRETLHHFNALSVNTSNAIHHLQFMVKYRLPMGMIASSSIISQGDDTFELINSHGPLRETLHHFNALSR